MLDDDLIFEAREIALSQDISLGEVISQLAQRGLESPAPPKLVHGIPVFRRRSKSTPVTVQDIRLAQDED